MARKKGEPYKDTGTLLRLKPYASTTGLVMSYRPITLTTSTETSSTSSKTHTVPPYSLP